MLFEVLKYEVFSDIAGSRAEVAARPEMPSPVSLAEFGKLALDVARRAPLHPLHHLRDRTLRRDRDQQMDMVARQHALDDRHAQFGAGLADDIPDAPPQIAFEDLVSVFRRPDDVIPMVEYRVCACVVCGHGHPVKNETLPPPAGLIFHGVAMKTIRLS